MVGTRLSGGASAAQPPARQSTDRTSTTSAVSLPLVDIIEALAHHVPMEKRQTVLLLARLAREKPEQEQRVKEQLLIVGGADALRAAVCSLLGAQDKGGSSSSSSSINSSVAAPAPAPEVAVRPPSPPLRLAPLHPVPTSDPRMPPANLAAIFGSTQPDDEFRASLVHAFLERRFEERLRARGLHIRRMLDDGNCLFRSVSDRVYGDAEMHDVVRRLCLDHMEKERDHFSQYVTEDFDAYLRRKRRDRVFGNHLEIQAISEIYNRPVHVFDVRGDTEAPMNTFTAPSEGEAGAPLRLSYHGRSHYNVIVDPTVADVGDGLGLPGFHPGLADRMQVEQAQQASETSAIESQFLSSARDASDVDATQDALLQAALAASAAEAGVGWAGGAGAASWPGAGIGAWAGVARSCWACMQVLTTAPVPLSPHRYRRMGRRGRMGRRRERGRERCLLRRRQRALRLVRAYGVGC